MSLFSGMKLTAGKKPAKSISAKVQDDSTSAHKTPDRGGNTGASKPSYEHQSHVLQVKEMDGMMVEGDLRLKETLDGSPSQKEKKTCCATKTMRTDELGKSVFSFITESDDVGESHDHGTTRVQTDDQQENNPLSDNLDLDPFSIDVPPRKGQISDTMKLSVDLEGLDLSSVSLSPEEETSNKTDLVAALEVMAEGVDDDDEAIVQDEELTYTGKESVDDNQRLLDLDEDQEMGYMPISFDVDVIKTDEKSADEQKEEHKGVAKEPDYDLQLSVKEKLEVMQEMHAAKLKHISEAVNELLSQISVTSSECVLSSSNLLHKQQMLIHIQDQQSEAVAKADYEQAESLNKQSESLELELQQIPKHIIPSNQPVILDIIETIMKLQVEEKSCSDIQLRDLNEMREKQEVLVEEVKGQYAKIEMSENDVLEEEESNLQRDVGHLNLDREHLERKEQNLGKRIDDKTANLREERDKLCEKRNKAQIEIEELKKKLASLQDEEEALAKEIGHQEDLIVKAKQEFAEEVHALEEERSKVNEKDASVKAREEKIKQIQEMISCKLGGSKAKVTREESLLVLISEAIERQKQDLLDLTEMSKRDTMTSARLRIEENHEIDSLREKLKTTSSTVQSLTAEVLQTQTKIVSLRQKVSDTEGHIAALTEAKQMAVSGRNFAEAKRLTNNIKELTSEGQKCQEELETLIGNNEKKNRELEEMQKDINKVREDLLLEEKSYDSNLKSRLLQHIQEVEQTCKETDSQDALFRTLNEADMKSCAMIIQYLCIKHGESLPDGIQEYVVQEAEDDGKSFELESSKITKVPAPSSVDSTTVHKKIEALEVQLQAAVDEEDYDTAQLLQEQIEELQKNMATKE